MSELTDYVKVLSEAIAARNDWLEKSELPKLREDLRIFRSSYAALYAAFLRKGLIKEDPYKEESKVSAICVPDSSVFPDNEKTDRLSRRLADFDNQLDFLANFFQANLEFLALDRIKSILGLIKFIDWVHLTPLSSSINTRCMSALISEVRVGLDPLSLNLINESTTNLIKSTGVIIASLKATADFNKEAYKLAVRTAITTAFPEDKAPTLDQIKKKFPTTLPDKPFYREFIEEILQEDYSQDSKALRDAVLHSLKMTDKMEKKEKAAAPLKAMLIEGIQSLGSIVATLTEIATKLDENEALLANKRRTLWRKVKDVIDQMLNKEPEPVIYELQYAAAGTGAPTRERVNFATLRADIDKRVKNLSQVGASKGAAAAKLEALQESQLVEFLERNIRDIQSLHRTLAALDEYFKASVDKEDRSRVKGIKPELSAIKNAFIRATHKQRDYNAQKEEDAQFKKLGIEVD
jgi:hypothetical protein